MDPIRIYLGDLTYDTITLSNEVFPLNIGYVAAYCLARHGDRVSIRLFKYITDLEQEVEMSPPDILALSNYPWNHYLDRALFRAYRRRHPGGLTVMGGPNFPHDRIDQAVFLASTPEVDVYVHLDGEAGFANLVGRALDAGPGSELRRSLRASPVEGCISRGPDGTVHHGTPVPRLSNLDDIPSPYLTGILDPFFDGRLNPMLQTNRGCPFSCTFCHDGSDLVNRVNKFSLDRVAAEIQYMAAHVPSTTHSLFVSDLNFGMIPRDLEVCTEIAKVQKKHGWPYYIDATTGKNSKGRVIEAIRRLNGAMRLTMSVQSMDMEVLTNIKRDNISLDHMMALQPAIKEANLATSAEVILGLPGETYESHLKTLADLVRAGVDHIVPHSLMLLHGTELNTREERERWDFQTKFRVLPRDFVRLTNGEKVIEVEEVVVGSRSLGFEEYVELRLFSFFLHVTTMGVIFDAPIKFLRESGTDVFQLFRQALERRDQAPPKLLATLESFRYQTSSELWDSAEAIQAHYQDDAEYEKLLQGEAGINVIQHHRAIVMEGQMEEWTTYVLDIARSILTEANLLDATRAREFRDVANYTRGLGTNILGHDRLDTSPECEFHHDVVAWLADTTGRPLSDFANRKPVRVAFRITTDQYKRVQDVLAAFGDTPVGRSKALIRLPARAVWRIPVSGHAYPNNTDAGHPLAV